jgi:hypothetical protein
MPEMLYPKKSVKTKMRNEKEALTAKGAIFILQQLFAAGFQRRLFAGNRVSSRRNLKNEV